ncbi:IclR family transcriptional regulator [Microbacterium sp. AG790]|uniref:IclR family transcriptional regulator n=1 Tax=Microbacterium sp. AG790 TaxID=2183995 RepID=UPI000EAE2AA6|nr:IclR family transcriptional regulator C-terminal domain-containing protein [Microbacterium sp. AG790]RKS93350.1 IclR family transcriptional regulator [Microbacterium sp. AG790]
MAPRSDSDAAAHDAASRSSMGRGFDVLSALAGLTAENAAGASVQQVAHALGRERSQISRTLAALHERGLAVRDDDGGYRLSWSWYADAQELVHRRLRTDGLAVLDALSATTGEACFLGVLAGDATVTIVESIPAGSRMIGSWIGRAYPAFCSDAGRAVLWDADDDEIRAVFADTDFASGGPRAARSVDEFLGRLAESRQRGFAIVDEEAEPELFSVSAPVWDFRGEVVAGLQIVGERAALSARVDELGARCIAAASALSHALGARAASI